MNFSHGNYEFFQNLFEKYDKACKSETKTPLSVLVDLQGPKIRVGELVNPKLKLNPERKLKLQLMIYKGTKSDKFQLHINHLVDDSKLEIRF